jgi:hypothetical protein
MTEGKPHPVLAGLADVCSAAIIFGAPVAIYVALVVQVDQGDCLKARLR